MRMIWTFSVLWIVILVSGNGWAQVIHPELKTWQLDNGLTAALMPMKSGRAVEVQIWYRVGSKDELPGKQGTAHMFEHMMFQGTKHVRPKAHTRMLSDLGGETNTFTTEDATVFTNTVPVSYFDFTLKLEAERMQHLFFRDEMIENEKKVLLAEIRQRERDPLAQGFLKLLSSVYKNHPYAWTAAGSREGLQAISRKDLETFYENYYVPQNALVVIVGDVKESDARTSVEKHFGSIRKGKTPLKRLSYKNDAIKNNDNDGLQNAGGTGVGVVLSGYSIPKAKHADIPALQVMALILSGGKTSRLYNRLVLQKAMTQNVGGQLMVREDPGLLLTYALFMNESERQPLQDAMNDEILQLTKQTVNKRDVQKAVNQLSSNLAFGLQDPAGMANKIGDAWIKQNNPRSFLTRMSIYKNVTASDVLRVAKKYLTPEHRTIVVISPKGGVSK